MDPSSILDASLEVKQNPLDFSRGNIFLPQDTFLSENAFLPGDNFPPANIFPHPGQANYILNTDLASLHHQPSESLGITDQNFNDLASASNFEPHYG